MGNFANFPRSLNSEVQSARPIIAAAEKEKEAGREGGHNGDADGGQDAHHARSRGTPTTDGERGRKRKPTRREERVLLLLLLLLSVCEEVEGVPRLGDQDGRSRSTQHARHVT